MSDVRAAVVGALIGSATVVSGTLLEKFLDKGNFDHEFLSESRNSMVDKRFELIRDFSNQINSVDFVIILDAWNQKIASVGPVAEEFCQNSSSNEVDSFACLHDKIILTSLKYRQDMTDRNSRFVSTIQMSNLLFGPKVSVEIKDIKSERWWSTDQKEYIDLLKAMREELYYFE